MPAWPYTGNTQKEYDSVVGCGGGRKRDMGWGIQTGESHGQLCLEFPCLMLNMYEIHRGGLVPVRPWNTQLW